MKIQKYLNKYHSLKDKNIVVTGANSGIGFELSKHLLFLNANLIMACRNLKRAEDAKNELLKLYPNSNIKIFIYDQASFDSINNFCNEIKDIKVDFLVCNAGVYYPKKKMVTKDNFELTVGTNYFGETYLLDKLEKKLINDQTRVIIVSSLTAINSKMRPLTKINSLSRNSLYGYSKLLISSSTYERMLEKKYKIVLVHPGVCATNILNNKDTGLSSSFALIGRKFLNIFVHSAAKASLCLLEGIECNYQDFMYIAPRGILAISGYPKIKKIPNKFKKYKMLEQTREFIGGKNNVIS